MFFSFRSLSVFRFLFFLSLFSAFLFPVFLGLGEYERSHRRENYSSSLPETLLMT